MGNDPDQRLYARTLGALCAFILCVLLTAGLWPFCAPTNDVKWLMGANGLRFGRHGIVSSVDGFRTDSQDGESSLEIQLEPGRVDGSGTILAFDSSPDPQFPFALLQFGNNLAFQRGSVDSQGKMVRPWLQMDRILEKHNRMVLTITGGKDKTVVYINGVPVIVSPGFGLVSGDLTGRLVLGNSTISDSWQGQIAGLALYDYSLTPFEAETHYERWARGQSPVLYQEKAPVAMYLFDEHTGSVVHDRMGSGNDLVIPVRYYVLHPSFLSSPLGPFRDRWAGWRGWSYWSDVCLNLAGFVPLGFFFHSLLFAGVADSPASGCDNCSWVDRQPCDRDGTVLSPDARFQHGRRHFKYDWNRRWRGLIPAVFDTEIPDTALSYGIKPVVAELSPHEDTANQRRRKPHGLKRQVEGTGSAALARPCFPQPTQKNRPSVERA